MPVHLLRFGLLPLILQLSLSGMAQTGSVWESGRQTVRSSRQKAGKAAARVHDWKNHLQRWGLDSTYTRSLSAGARLNSDGWSGLLSYGRKDERGRLAVWQLIFSEVKHEKETKQQGSASFPALSPATPYTFGKRNNLYMLQFGYARERTILPAVLDGNVGVGLRYGGGLSLAALKPYYLRLAYPDQTSPGVAASEQEERYGDANADQFLNPGQILGRGQWSRGLDEMTVVPGLHGELAAVIHPANAKAFTQAISLGVQAALFAKQLPVLVDNAGASYRVCLYAGLELGKRWR